MLVKQIVNLLDLLEYFVQRKQPATLTEISQDLQWPRSSTFNLVGTLLEKGYLYEPQLRKGYYPSPRWLQISQAIVDAEPTPAVLNQIISEIALETGETSAICAAAGTHVVLNYVQESRHSIRYHAAVGTRVPIYASSSGRAILAQYSEEERQLLYRKLNFEVFTDNTPVDANAVEAELSAAQKRGYHQSHAEYISELAGVAVPLILPQRRLSVVVAGPVSRCLERREEFARVINQKLASYRDKM